MLQGLGKAVAVLTLYMASQLVPAQTEPGVSGGALELNRKRDYEVSHLHHTQEHKPGAQHHREAGSRQPTSLTHLLKVILGLVGCRLVCV